MKRFLIVLAACSTAPRVPVVRFANAPAVDTVNDRLDVPEKPCERLFLDNLYHYDGLVQRRMTRAMELHPPTRALGVNALDEVPDSTWFTNRIGVRDLTLEQVAKGPNAIGSPELYKPWTVKSTKVGGAEIGLIITDTRGEKFLLKFDQRGYPEQETGAHVIVEKILWAVGYNVTDDYIVHFRATDLVLAKDAYIKDSEVDPKRPLHADELERRLARVEQQPNGAYRALASHWLAGKPVGGHPAEGVRSDDPNDRISHELRRDLRGLYTFAAWLDHVDIQEGNFLDMWVTDPVDKNRHYLEHYAVDYGKSLGVFATTAEDPRRGFDYWLDPAAMSRSLFSVGLLRRRWESRDYFIARGVGAYDVASFDPGDWRPSSAAYVPFTTVDRYDAFWAAKIAMRLSRPQIHAIVETARYSDPKATEYLTDAIVARQRMTGAYWFARVNPLDAFTMTGAKLCFEDLAVKYHFTAAPTTYTATTFDRDGTLLETSTSPETCTRPLALGGGPDAYTIVELATRRGEYAGRTLVHIARDRSGELRVIGVWRP